MAAAKEGEGQGTEGSGTGDAGGSGGEGGELNFSGMTLEQARAAAAQFYHEKAKANLDAARERHKQKDLAERLKAGDEAQAKLKQLEDAQKSEAQKAAERAQKAEQDLAQERAARVHAQDMVAVMAGGVAEPYAEFVATQLAKARGSTEGFDVSAFITEQQKASPAFFLAQHQQEQGNNGTSKEPPKRTAGGGPGAGSNGKSQLSAQLAEVEKALEQANTQRNVDLSWRLSAERDRLRRELNK